MPVLTKEIIDNIEEGQDIYVAMKVGDKYLPTYIHKVGAKLIAWYTNECDKDPETQEFRGISDTNVPIAQAEVVGNIIGISCDHDADLQGEFATAVAQAIEVFECDIEETAWEEVTGAMQYRYGY